MTALTLSPFTGDFLSPTILRIDGPVSCAVWDVPRPAAATSPSLTTQAGAQVAPASALRLPLANGGTRIVVAFRVPGRQTSCLRMGATLLSSPIPVEVGLRSAPGFFDIGDIGQDLTLDGRRLLLLALVGTWPSLFKLGRCRSYLDGTRTLVGRLVGRVSPARALGSFPIGGMLLEAALPAGIEAIEEAFVLSPGTLDRLPGKACCLLPDPAGRGALAHCPISGGGAGGLLVLRTRRGVLVRTVPPRAPPVRRWWAAKAARHPKLRAWLVDVLTRHSEAAAALARELQLATPLNPAAWRGREDAAAAISVAIGTPAGMFVTGWMHDPNRTIEEIAILAADGHRVSLTGAVEAFPGQWPGSDGVGRPASGFAGLLPVPDLAANLQPRFILRLRSGTEIPLLPEPQPAEPTEKRARIAASIQPQHVTERMLERSLGPAFAVLQAQIRAKVGKPTVVTLGCPPAGPEASIIVPLYRVLDFLRTQVAAFAADPWIRARAEIIYVLDTPEQAGACEHLLRGLEMTYGLPLRLVVMERNGGFSAACNTGAAVATGRVLAFVNSDVIPAGNGWLKPLCDAVGPKTGCGAAGPKLLFADGALQHAGLLFKQDTRGWWRNHHYFKGLPGGWPPAGTSRAVPGVTGACMAIPRTVFDAVEGFTEDYIIGDYEDSDLCLKIRTAGHEIVYEPAATLYHLERQSIRHSSDYQAGNASLYNCWLQTQRWGDAIAALMSRFEGEPSAMVPRPRPALTKATVAKSGAAKRTSIRRRENAATLPVETPVAPSRGEGVPLRLAGFSDRNIVVRPAGFQLAR